MKEVSGGITAAKGFRAAGVAAGLKPQAKDVALLVSETAATAAAVFTQNTVQAAPVIHSRQVIERGSRVYAVVINSGNANACTGPRGLSDALRMATETADALAVDVGQVVVASTGVIGVPLPIETVCAGIRAASEQLACGKDASDAAAEAMMTTDTVSKQVAVTVPLKSGTVTIGGMAKGSGMIHPNMATMLSFVTTDATLSQPVLQALLSDSVNQSYNMISVDGDTSTNDMVVVLANGASDTPPLEPGNPDFEAFRKAFDLVHQSLAKKIVRDGEGATKFLEVSVRNAATVADARKLVKSVITSSLVKTAFFGEDANWGRILAAMGRAGANFDPSRVSISFQSAAGHIVLMQDSEPIAFDEGLAKHVLTPREVQVEVVLCDGESDATGWGCDLSYEYVRINGDYRT